MIILWWATGAILEPQLQMIVVLLFQCRSGDPWHISKYRGWQCKDQSRERKNGGISGQGRGQAEVSRRDGSCGFSMH